MEVIVAHLNAKVKFLEKKVVETPDKVQNNHCERIEKDREHICKLCDFKCVKNKILKVHLKENHRREISGD